MLSKLLVILVVKEEIKVKLALAIPTGTPTTLLNEMIDTPLRLKPLKLCLCNQK